MIANKIYPCYLFRSHGIIYFSSNQDSLAKGVIKGCECGAPDATPKVEYLKLEKKYESEIEV